MEIYERKQEARLFLCEVHKIGMKWNKAEESLQSAIIAHEIVEDVDPRVDVIRWEFRFKVKSLMILILLGSH